MSIRKMFFMLTVVFCTACSSDLFISHSGNIPDAEKISQVHSGQTKEQVLDILGSPSLVTGLNGNHWVYMSSTVKRVAFMRPKEMDRNILAITFKENKVSKLETRTLADGNDISIDSDVTQAAERDDGFFRKYFGGVGAYNPLGGSSSSLPSQGM